MSNDTKYFRDVDNDFDKNHKFCLHRGIQYTFKRLLQLLWQTKNNSSCVSIAFAKIIFISYNLFCFIFGLKKEDLMRNFDKSYKHKKCYDFSTSKLLANFAFSTDVLQLEQLIRSLNCMLLLLDVLVACSNTHMEHNCPLDKIQLVCYLTHTSTFILIFVVYYPGYHTWNLLHTIVANYPDEPSPQKQEDINQFFDLIGRLYPCQACGRDFTHFYVVVCQHLCTYIQNIH
ncbi:FAD-linked sulfhydryl oxidase ALR-like [Aphis craccivora]|uniref:Sulfhydryl oxidase n=1 Tax=Aphis craccivora TaxID=307492 RepID=A0A6G0YVU9_APHCR|nr:FAD-linked sulfhydryl oxidase ALR-like [Aphis craccivora]